MKGLTRNLALQKDTRMAQSSPLWRRAFREKAMIEMKLTDCETERRALAKALEQERGMRCMAEVAAAAQRQESSRLCKLVGEAHAQAAERKEVVRPYSRSRGASEVMAPLQQAAQSRFLRACPYDCTRW